MFGGLTVQDTMAEILGRIFRVPVNGKPITIFELGGLPSEVINVVVSVLGRLAFDFGLWSGGQVPITFVCEEAHRYVPNDKSLGFEPTKRAISRIAKEGRKYGVSLAIITQRPAELDPTILSQCNTIFSMRLTNERDQEILRAGISDAAASLLEFMPTMGAGEAVTFGEGVALPTRINFDLLPSNRLPKSTTASFTQNWTKEMVDEHYLHDIVTRWRQQTYNPLADSTVAEGMEDTVSSPQGTASGPAVEQRFAKRRRPSLHPDDFEPALDRYGLCQFGRRLAPGSPALSADRGQRADVGEDGSRNRQASRAARSEGGVRRQDGSFVAPQEVQTLAAAPHRVDMSGERRS